MGHPDSPSKEPVTQQVITAVAEKEGVDEADLETPLYDVIDPDALDTLFRGGSGTVRFEYLEYVVTVDSDNTVEVAPAENRGER